MKPPIISVVTVVRNNLEGLKRTISSLQQQDTTLFEHVIIDGDSSDGTQTYVTQNYPNSHRIHFQSEPDDGLYDAMNKGLEVTSGRIVLFLNGGDILAEPTILREVADSYVKDHWAWSFGQLSYADAKGRSLWTYTGRPYSLRQVELGLAYVPHPTCFTERDRLIAAGGFRSEFGWSADQELMTRIGSNSNPHIFDKVVSVMEVGGAHATNSFYARALRYHKIRRSHDNLMVGNGLVDVVFSVAQGSAWQIRAIIRKHILRRAPH